MILDDRSREAAAYSEYAVRRVRRDGSSSEDLARVQAEHSMEVIVDGKLTMRLVCSPDHLPELVLGRLFSEGIIASADDVDMISVCEYGSQAHVLLAQGHRADFTRASVDEVPSCCTGNKVLNKYFVEDDTLRPVAPFHWEPDWIFAMADLLAADTPAHRATFGTHSCFLSVAGEVVCCREDIGRHNAFDKVLGYALSEGVDLGRAIMYSSGRIPEDMVTKAIRAGVPVLASKAVPTDRTIAIAAHYDLTLVCSARPDSMTVYCDPAHPPRFGMLEAATVRAADPSLAGV